MKYYINDYKNFYKKDLKFLSLSSTSYARDGSNKDFVDCLYEQNGRKVILDVMGQGYIAKIFIPDCSDKNIVFDFIIDGKLLERISYLDLFNKKSKVFSSNNLGFTNDISTSLSNTGGFLVEPIIFYKSAKIIVDKCDHLYYHINYMLLENNLRDIKLVCENKKDDICNSIVENEIKINKNVESSLININGKKVCNQFKIFIPNLLNKVKIFPYLSEFENLKEYIKCVCLGNYKKYCLSKKSYEVLKNINISIYCDGKERVNSNLLLFFGFSVWGIDKGVKDYLTQSSMVGLDSDGWLYCNFPIPFKENLDIRIYSSLKNLQIKVAYNLSSLDTDDFLYFCTIHNNVEIQKNDKSDIRLLDIMGNGKLVGINASFDSNDSIKDANYLEGDEHIYIDNAISPQINGTGTEDFFLGAYYWISGARSYSTFGCSYNEKWHRGKMGNSNKNYKSSAYRFMLNDFIEFNERLVFDIEHGSYDTVNDSHEKIEFLAYAYINDCALKSEKQSLKLTKNNSYKLCSRFEGYSFNKEEELNITVIHKNEELAIPIISGKYKYLLLRITLDYSQLNQKIDVFANDNIISCIYKAGSNQIMQFSQIDSLICLKDVFSLKLIAKSDICLSSVDLIYFNT